MQKRRRSIKESDSENDSDQIFCYVGLNILKLRKNLNITQQCLARKAGVASSTLSDIERGQAHDVKLSTLVSLGQQLNIDSISDLFKPASAE